MGYFDDRYRELQQKERKIERLRQKLPLTPRLARRIEAMKAEVEKGWHELAEQILMREG